MRLIIGLAMAVALTGCSRPVKKTSPTDQVSVIRTNLPTTSKNSVPGLKTNPPRLPKTRGIAVLQGQVVHTDLPLKFAVISFLGGVLPEKDQRLSVFRGGTKVGEIRMTGPFQATSAVGDISTGEAAPGDTVQMD